MEIIGDFRKRSFSGLVEGGVRHNSLKMEWEIRKSDNEYEQSFK